MKGLICYGRKNLVTRFCEYIWKYKVKEGYILHPCIDSMGWKKELRRFMRG